MKVLLRLEPGRYKYAYAKSLVPTPEGMIRVEYPSGKSGLWNKDEVLNEKYEKICFDLM